MERFLQLLFFKHLGIILIIRPKILPACLLILFLQTKHDVLQLIGNSVKPAETYGGNDKQDPDNKQEYQIYDQIRIGTPFPVNTPLKYKTKATTTAYKKYST